MKRIGIVIAAVAALAFGVAPLAAQAAPAPAKLPPITQKQRDEGKAQAPAAVALSKITCGVSDAYLVQSGTDSKTKVKTSIYEVACNEGPGYIVQQIGEMASAFDCLAQEETAARTPGSLVCRLDANADPKQGLARLAQGLGKPACTATGARIMGATATGDTYYEVACGGPVGYVIQTSLGKPAVVSECIETLGGGATECTLTTKAAILAGLGDLAGKSGKTCAVSDGRLVGRGSGSSYYELACGGSQGFMIKASATGAFEEAIDCSKAQPIGGGCTLTVVDETAEAGTYTKLAQAAAYPCDVSKYRYLGKETKSNSEIVELACKNRPDGAIALFPIAGGKSQVFDCVQGGSIGVTCQLSQPTAVYAKYTEKLVSQGKTQCKVSGAKYLASTTAGADFIETACSDGLPGFVISVDHTTGAVKELLTCGQASRSGAACTLPTNLASAN